MGAPQKATPGEAPTTRSITTYLAAPALKKMIADLRAIKAEMSPDDDTLPELPAAVNIEAVDTLMWPLLAEHPAFADLVFRDPGSAAARPAADSESATPAAEEWWREPTSPPESAVSPGAGIGADVLAVLESDGDLEEESLRRLPADWDTVEPESGAGTFEP